MGTKLLLFFDVDSIREGKFPEAINQNIARSENFLIILTPDSLERCISPEDWVRKELSAAIRLNKNIIPVACSGFSYPDKLPEDIALIKSIQTVSYNGVNFNDAVEKIIFRLKDQQGNALRLTKKGKHYPV